QLAELEVGQPGLKARLVGPDRNPAQMPPVDILRRGLASGELDASIVYGLAVNDRGLPFVELPAEVSLSDPAHEGSYARARYRTADGIELRGGLVYYTATVLANAPHSEAGTAFVTYLLSEEAQV